LGETATFSVTCPVEQRLVGAPVASSREKVQILGFEPSHGAQWLVLDSFNRGAKATLLATDKELLKIDCIAPRHTHTQIDKISDQLSVISRRCENGLALRLRALPTAAEPPLKQ
jgi:hypothetical protein